MPVTAQPRPRRAWIAVAVLAAAAFLLTAGAPIDYTFGDPWGNLLTAQAILEHGTVRLDAYADSEALAELHLGWHHGGHTYYYFPVGTAVLALPAVGLARLAGMDMAEREDNSALQRLLAALTVAVSVPLVFALCRLYLSVSYSLLVTVAFTFGSSTVSTLGTALWSTNPTLLLHLTVLLVLVRDARGARQANPYLLGVLLFAAYLCRPTAAVFCLAVFAYAFFRRRGLLLGMSLAVALPLGALALFSLAEYGQLLPPYYQPSRLGTKSFPTALFGQLLSPSRGLLVLNPYLAVVLLGALALGRRVLRDDFFRLGLAWLTLHWIVVSSYRNWWSGWDYGSRYFADALPAAILITVVVGRAAAETAPRRVLKLSTLAFGALAAFAVYIHSWKGLYDVHPFLWCRDGTYVDHLFDWRHPQFLATTSSLAEHRREHLLPALPLRPLAAPILPASRDVLFEGWSRPESGGAWRWTEGTSAAVLFKIDPGEPAAREEPLALEVVAGTHQRQEIGVRVNGVDAGTIESGVDWEPATHVLRIPPSALGRDAYGLDGARVVEVELSIPGARRAPGDHRLLGLCLRRLTLRATD